MPKLNWKHGKCKNCKVATPLEKCLEDSIKTIFKNARVAQTQLMNQRNLTRFNPTQLSQLDEEKLLLRQQEFLAAATAENTRRSYRTAIRHFLSWGGYLPCDSAMILRYVLSQADLCNPRTMAVRLTALGQWHSYQGFADPTQHGDVRLSLRGIQRSLGRPAKQAKALRLQDLQSILLNLGQSPSLQSRRDAALLSLGFYGGFRRSELVAINCEDLTFTSEGLLVLMRKSKTDQYHKGQVKAIPGLPESVRRSVSEVEFEHLCPVVAIESWLKHAGLTCGPVFRQVTRWQQVTDKALYAGTVSQILRRCAAAANLKGIDSYSAHSLRRGMATSAHQAGASMQEIKRQGAWRHDATVQVYIEEAELFKNNAANKLMQQQFFTQNENSTLSEPT